MARQKERNKSGELIVVDCRTYLRLEELVLDIWYGVCLFQRCSGRGEFVDKE